MKASFHTFLLVKEHVILSRNKILKKLGDYSKFKDRNDKLKLFAKHFCFFFCSQELPKHVQVFIFKLLSATEMADVPFYKTQPSFKYWLET